MICHSTAQKVIESRPRCLQNKKPERSPVVAWKSLEGNRQRNRKPAMTNHKRIPDSNADQLPSELTELGQVISSIELEDRRHVDIAFDRVAESVRRRRRILNLVQEALAQLRLDVKYLMFDLEITRKERDELRAQMEEEDPGF
jgi:hypothetical protein